MPNSVVKPLSADGSVGSPHVRVGHRQASIPNPSPKGWGFFFIGQCKIGLGVVCRYPVEGSGSASLSVALEFR